MGTATQVGMVAVVVVVLVDRVEEGQEVGDVVAMTKIGTDDPPLELRHLHRTTRILPKMRRVRMIMATRRLLLESHSRRCRLAPQALMTMSRWRRRCLQR